MKITKFLLSAFCALAFIACDDQSDTPAVTPPASAAAYLGEMVVGQNDGTSFTAEDLVVSYELNDDNTMDIVLTQAQFAAAMPLKLDMTIPAADYTVDKDSYVISDSNIVPLALGGEFPMYTISSIEGTITKETMTLEFMCGLFPVSYNGTIAK